ncbi:MAG: alpha-L-fucosidase, partial [Bacteroidales bacterium]|nr:alpha-L-fucosidase [Bacteroidales bacterium]
EWANAEVGVMFHYDMQVYQTDYQWRKWGTHPPAEIFNPSDLNTDQWIEAAKNIGAKYAVLVAKHCCGFSLWPTKAHDYSIKNSPWKDGKGDIVADFIASCRKYGVKPGIYASTTANGYCWVDNPGVVKPGAPVTQEEYNRIVEQQLTELWSNYGELFEIWFDGGVLAREKGGANVLELVQKLQSNAIAFQGPYGHPNLIRWVGNENGVAPYPCWATADSTTNADGTVVINGLNGNPFSPYWCPGEADFPIRSGHGGWMWSPSQNDKIFTTKELVEKYETSVGRNTNMLVGLVIDDRGRVPDADVKALENWGKAIRMLYDSPLRTAKGTGSKLTVRLDKPTFIDHLVIQEDISKGERVLAYKVSGKGTDGAWTELASGTNIGHKHIDRFPSTQVSEVKLEITDYKAKPQISNFAVYEVLKQITY